MQGWASPRDVGGDRETRNSSQSGSASQKASVVARSVSPTISQAFTRIKKYRAFTGQTKLRSKPSATAGVNQPEVSICAVCSFKYGLVTVTGCPDQEQGELSAEEAQLTLLVLKVSASIFQRVLQNMQHLQQHTHGSF